MLVVKIELQSAISPDRSKSLGTMEIELMLGAESTVVQTDGAWGDYRYRIRKWTTDKGVWKTGKVLRQNRKTRGPWDLLFRCLRDAVATRNPTG